MKKQICIVYEPCDEIKQGKSVITGDGSMIYVPSPSICPFSVYPYHWLFEIATSVVTENKYKLEYFLGNQVFLSCETAKLKKPTASAGCIYVEIDFPHADGVYYSDYEQFCKKKYYDPDNKILAIGDIYGEGKCIEFAKGQYVVIDDFNRLVSAFSLISERFNTVSIAFGGQKADCWDNPKHLKV